MSDEHRALDDETLAKLEKAAQEYRDAVEWLDDALTRRPEAFTWEMTLAVHDVATRGAVTFSRWKNLLDAEISRLGGDPLPVALANPLRALQNERRNEQRRNR